MSRVLSLAFAVPVTYAKHCNWRWFGRHYAETNYSSGATCRVKYVLINDNNNYIATIIIRGVETIQNVSVWKLRICNISLHMLKLLQYQTDCVSSGMDTTASNQSPRVFYTMANIDTVPTANASGRTLIIFTSTLSLLQQKGRAL